MKTAITEFLLASLVTVSAVLFVSFMYWVGGFIK